MWTFPKIKLIGLQKYDEYINIDTKNNHRLFMAHNQKPHLNILKISDTFQKCEHLINAKKKNTTTVPTQIHKKHWLFTPTVPIFEI